MKKNGSLKEILMPAVMLFIIAVVCTTLLALTNMSTKDKIAKISAEAENSAKQAVFSDAKTFSEQKTITVDDAEHIYFEAYDESGSVIGYVIPETTKSYGGDLSCIVGVSADEAKITGVEITTINDTAGLGMKAKNADFLDQYLGKEAGVSVNKNSSSDTEVKAITGATITSKAVTSAVNSAFSVYSAIKDGGNNG